MDPSTNDEEGLPDEAFTEDELAAGVQHIVRTGNPNAASSSHRLARPNRSKSAEAAEVELSLQGDACQYFETYEQALNWAKANPGGAIKRSSSGKGFEAKPVAQHQSSNREQRGIDAYRSRSAEIKALAPHLHHVLEKSGSNKYRVVMKPLYRNTWLSELSRLSPVQLKRLRMLIADHLEDSRVRLRLLYSQMRRFPSMKAGHYGEPLSERLNETMEGALVDIDNRLSKVRDA